MTFGYSYLCELVAEMLPLGLVLKWNFPIISHEKLNLSQELVTYWKDFNVGTRQVHKYQGFSMYEEEEHRVND